MKKLLWAGLFCLGLLWAIATFTGLAQTGEFDSLILNFDDTVTNSQIEAELKSLDSLQGQGFQLNSEFSDDENLYVVTGSRQLLKALRRSELADDLEYAEPNYIYSINALPNDPDYGKQWNLRSINVENAWDETQGEGITVAVIDTGITQVPDLENTTLTEGYDFVNDQAQANDDNGHGTHVAGTIAQSTNNNFGVAGIAHQATLMPLKVLSAGGGGTVADIAEAIEFAADNGATVINMSLGGGGESALMKEAINYAYNKGVTIIAAAGNENRNSASYPARYDHVLSVAAVDATGEKAPYSNYGAGVDISAPGGSLQGDSTAGGILQNTIDPQTGNSVFSAFQGTSMAAPHVAGVAALVQSAGMTAPDEVMTVLQESVRPVEDDPLNHYGAGQLDAASAVKLATQGQISGRDFWRWLRNSGYLNLKFWFDGGVVALLPKLAMVIGSYLLAWFLRNYFPFAWSFPLSLGLIAGSSGLFPLKGLYIFDLPQWPLRVAGSSISELGGAIQGSHLLNPLFASCLIPFLLIAFLLSAGNLKWFAIGSTLGMVVGLSASAVFAPEMLWLGDGIGARLFLGINALLCFLLAYFAIKAEVKPV